jgi:IS5 family transposase
VVETDVHYPTDINLLFDAVRKTVEECARLSQSCQLEGWRQYRNNLRQFKKQYRLIQKLRSSTSKVEQLNDHRQTAVDSDYRLKVEYETKVHHKG